MNILNIEEIKKISLPKRDVRVLVGTSSPISSDNMTFGVATVPPNSKMDPHTHSKEEEIIYILSGYGYVYIDGKKEDVIKGMVIKIDIGTSHYICNKSAKNMNFVFCFSPPVVIGSYDNRDILKKNNDNE